MRSRAALLQGATPHPAPNALLTFPGPRLPHPSQQGTGQAACTRMQGTRRWSFAKTRMLPHA